MLIEKTKLLIAKNWLIKAILVVCFLCAVLFVGKHLYMIIQHDIPELNEGIIGTLLGAIVGGVFTLLGSIIINKNVQKAQNAIKRKGIIYKPLYDELKNIHERILIDNPYPNNVSFEKEIQSYIPIPQYTVWGRIKNDSRYFEVPKKLRDEMEKLYKTIETYQDEYSKTCYTFDRFYREEHKKINDLPLPEDASYGGSLLRFVIDDSTREYRRPMWFDKELTDEQIRCFWNSCYSRAVDCIDYKRLKEAKNKWRSSEDKVLSLLSIYIEYIIVKYEG